jgi:hypothetical protein
MRRSTVIGALELDIFKKRQMALSMAKRKTMNSRKIELNSSRTHFDHIVDIGRKVEPDASHYEALRV